MDQATQYVRNNSSIISTVAFLAVLLVILYVVYTYLYPSDDPTYTQFLKGEADARKPIAMEKKTVPAIFTGGDFTFSTWIYIDDWNQRAGKYKFLFSISPETIDPSLSVSPLVGLLTPLKNGLMVRASSIGNKAAPANCLAKVSSSNRRIASQRKSHWCCCAVSTNNGEMSLMACSSAAI